MKNLVTGNFNKKVSILWVLLLVFLIYAFLGCTDTAEGLPDDSIIGLSKDSQVVVIRNLAYHVLLQIKNDSLTRDEFQQLFPVYKMPADTDMKNYQTAQPGAYQITDSLLTFKPDTPFTKHQAYFARFYGHSTDNNLAKMAQARGNLKGPKYTEAVFRL